MRSQSPALLRPLSLCLALTCSAHGALAKAPRDTGLARAQSYVQLAEKLYRAKDYAGALEEFRRALPLADEDAPRAIIQLNIAQCLLKLGRKADAVEAFEAYLTLPDDSVRKAKIERKTEALAREAFGRLIVECAQDGASVEVKDFSDNRQPCPWRARMRLGRYTISVTQDGFRPEQRKVEIKPGVEVTMKFTLSSAPSDAPALTDAPPPPADVGPGVWPWLVTGAGVAAAGVGLAYHLSAVESRDEVDDELVLVGDDPPDDYKRELNYARIAYGVGAAAVIGGVLWWALSEDDAPPEAVVIAPNGVGFRW